MNSIVNETDTLKVSSDEVLTAGNNWYVNASAKHGGDGSESKPFNTLNEALTKAQNDDTIMIASGEYNGTMNVGLTISKKLNFIKYGDGEAIFDAQGLSRIWTVDVSSINITGLTFKNGKADHGGAILIKHVHYFNINATFINNTAGHDGGAIYSYGVSGNLNGTFINNTAGHDGGAIYIYQGNGVSGNLNGTFINNTAGHDGGAIYIYEDDVSGNLSGTFINNTASERGGAIYIGVGGVSGNLSGTFINNNASLNGGAIFIGAGVSGILNGTFINNTASIGGAIYSSTLGGVSGNLSGTFINNNASLNGGAIYIGVGGVSGNLSGTFINNTAGHDGGAIFFSTVGVSGNLSGTFINNAAEYDGGAIKFYEGSVSGNLSGTFINNTASGRGGAIYISSGGVSGILDGTFINNTSKKNYGGAIFIFGSVSGNVGGTFINNTAEIYGGAIYIGVGGVSGNLSGTFINNAANYRNIIHIAGNIGVNARIKDAIFINNKNTIIFVYNGNIRVINSWFGNNATNYNIKPSPGNVNMDNWLFLNATANPTELNVGETSSISFKLDSYNETSKDVSPYDASKMNAVLELSQTLGELNQSTALIGENVTYTAKQSGNASITGKFVTALYTIELHNVKISTEINITNSTISLKANEKVDTGAILTPADAGNLTYTSSNITVAIVENGVIKGLKEGTTIITVSFAGNEQYAPADNKTINVTVSVNEASVSVNNDTLDLNVDDAFELIAITIPVGLNVTYESSDESVITVDDNGKVNAKSKGTAIITVNVGGDGVYALNSTTVGVTVHEKPMPPKENLTISASADSIITGDNATVFVTGFKNATGEVSVTVGSNKWTGEISEGIARVVVPGLTESVTAVVSYAGDACYNPASTTVNITVNPKPRKNLTIEATSKPITVGDNATVVVTGLKDATGEVTVIVNGKTYTAPIKNSEAKVTIPGLTESVTGNVNYAGDERYNPASTTVKITVNPNVIIDAPDVTKYYGGSERFAVTLKDLNGNPIANADIKITINGKTYTKTTDKNGETSIGINLNSGVYDVTTEYNGTKVHSTVTIKDTVIAKDVTKIFRNGTQYQGTFVDSKGNLVKNTEVQININGVFYKRTTDANGMAQLNINLPPGTYILTAINPSSGEQHTTTVTVLPNIVENYDLTKYYKNASQYSLRLLDDKGNPVGAGVSIQLNINGVFYTRTSDANGYVKMDINLPPGTYIVTAEYKGLRVSNTINVLSVLEANDLVMRYHDGSQFKAKVLDGQGRPYAGQTVKYNINGVFYTKTTDGDGIAALTINLPAGEYIITSMYNGLNVANKVTVIG